MSISADGRFLAATRQGDLKVWKVASRECVLDLPKVDDNDGWNSATLSPNGNRLAGAHSPGKEIHVIDIPSGLRAFRFDGNRKPVFSPDGRLLAVISPTANVVDATTGMLLYGLIGHEGAVNALVFDRRSERIATAGADGTVRIWDAVTGKNLHCLRGHSGAATLVAFIPDGSRLASAGRNHTVRIWDTGSGQEAMMFKAEVSTLDFTPDGRSLIASTSTSLRAWDAYNPPVQTSSAGTQPTTEPAAIRTP